MIYEVRFGKGCIHKETKLIEAPTVLSAVKKAEAHRKENKDWFQGAVIQYVKEVGELEIR